MTRRPPSPAWLALVAAMCACQGQGQRLLEGFGRAMAIAAFVAAVVALIGLTVYALLLLRLLLAFTRAWRRGKLPDQAVPLSWFALGVALAHAPVVAFVLDPPASAPALALLAVLTLAVLAVLGVTATLAARQGARAPAGVAAVLVLAALVTAAWYYPQRTLDELPGQIVQLDAAPLIACAALTTGQIACEGANWDGQRGDGREHAAQAPTLVRGIADATAVAVGESIACALRRDHPVTCWGGDDDLPVPGPRRVPWLLPGGEAATMLAVSRRGVAALGLDGVLRTWPDPPPPGLGRARLLAGDHDFDGGWFCLVEETGGIACWEVDRGGPREPVRWPAPPPVQLLAVDADAELACALTPEGDVRCHNLHDDRPARALDGLGLRTLVAADDDGTFCGQDPAGSLLCWRGKEPPRELAELRGADAITGGAGALCGRLGDRHRCVLTGTAEHTGADDLLARDRHP